MISEGDVFYCKKARTQPSYRGQKSSFVEFTVKGHLIGLALGHVKEHDTTPGKNELLRLMARIGYFSGDDVVAVFGQSGFDKLGKYILETYPCGDVRGI